MDEKRELVRHMLATLAYRAARALDGAPDHFAGFAGAGRMPVQILAHMGDLFDWALSIVEGNQKWNSAKPLEWNAEVARFFTSIQAFDAYLASDQPMHSRLGRAVSPAKLFDRQRSAPGRTGGYCNHSFSSSPKRAPMRLYVSHGDNRVFED